MPCTLYSLSGRFTKFQKKTLSHILQFLLSLTTQYDKIGKLTRDFEPFKNLWITAADWLKWHETWMNDSLINIDPDLLTNNVNNAFKTMHKNVKHFKLVKLA